MENGGRKLVFWESVKIRRNNPRRKQEISSFIASLMWITTDGNH